MQLDLESFDSVINFVMSIRERDMAVDTIFNNAGTMPGTMKLTADGYESATQTNFLSTALLTQMLLPRIINGGAIVFTTSMTRHIAKLRTDWKQHAITHHNRFTTYGRSKLMLTHYALDLAHELAPRGIRVNCSDPGIVDSGIITLGNRVIDMLSDKFFRPLISTPAQGAAPALNAAGTQLTGQIFTLNHCSPKAISAIRFTQLLRKPSTTLLPYRLQRPCRNGWAAEHKNTEAHAIDAPIKSCENTKIKREVQLSTESIHNSSHFLPKPF